MFAKHIFCVLFLSAQVGSLFCAQNKLDEALAKTKRAHLLFEESPEPFEEESIKNSSSSSSSGTNELPGYFEGVPIKTLLAAFNSAPEDARDIVDHLQNPWHFNDPSYRKALFFGEPGTGKTLIAKAIAYTMWLGGGAKEKKEEVENGKDEQKSEEESKKEKEIEKYRQQKWHYRFIASTAIEGSHRGEKAKVINELFKDVVKNSPMILIIDEVDRLLDHATSEHYDNDVNGPAIWINLDSQNGNHNFFFIGLTNNEKTLAKPFQDRMRLCTYLFTTCADNAKRSQRLKDHTIDGDTQLHALVTDQFLIDLLSHYPEAGERDYQGIASKIKRASRKSNQSAVVKIVTPEHLKQAFAKFREVYDRSEYAEEQVSEPERLQRVSMAHQSMISASGIEVQLLVNEHSKPIYAPSGSVSLGLGKNADGWGLGLPSGSVSVAPSGSKITPEGCKKIRQVQQRLESSAAELRGEPQSNNLLPNHQVLNYQPDFKHICAMLTALMLRKLKAQFDMVYGYVAYPYRFFRGENNPPINRVNNDEPEFIKF